MIMFTLNRRLNIFCLACVCALFVMLSACKKDPAGIIGEGIQPNDELIFAVFNDSAASLRLMAYTVPDDSAVVTSGKSFYALGSYNHPDFGTLTANIITQIHEISYVTLEAGWMVDSVVLRLVYHSAHPSSETGRLDEMTISIGELLEGDTIDPSWQDRRYRHNENRAQFQGSVLSDYRFFPHLRDSVVDPNDSTRMLHNPIERIRLNVGYGEKLLNASQGNPGMNDFLRQVPGLYIEAHPATPRSNQGHIVNIQSFGQSGESRIIVYYRTNMEDTISLERHYSLGFAGGMTYNYYHFDRTGANPDLVQQLDENLPLEERAALGEDKVFLQSFYGSLIRVEMPDIKGFAEEVAPGRQIAINQATLVMSVEPNGRFTPPSAMDIGHQRAADTMVGLPDHGWTVGGQFNESRQEYRFFVTQHVQRLLSNPAVEPVPLTIYSGFRHSLPETAIIKGPGAVHGAQRMRLEVVYSVLP